MGGVSAPGWLEQLAPAHAPPPASWWPLAPGWWVLLAALLLAAALIAFWLRRPGGRLRRIALRELRDLERGAGDDVALARAVELLLRRYAIARFGRERVARLSGDRWIAFVAEHGGSALRGDAGRTLLRAVYGGTADGERAGWLRGARGFLETA